MKDFNTQLKKFLGGVVIKNDVPPELQEHLKDSFCCGFVAAITVLGEGSHLEAPDTKAFALHLQEQSGVAIDTPVNKWLRSLS